MSEVDDPVNCPSGSALPQVVTQVARGSESNLIASCDMKLTNEAWMEEYTVFVKATTDLLYDGNHTADLNIERQYTTMTEEQSDSLITSQVCHLLYKIVHCDTNRKW